MKKNYIIAIIVVVVLSVAFFFWPEKDESKRGENDATSSATFKGSEALTLPMDSPDYKVWIQSGIKKYVVQYNETFYRGGTINTLEGAQSLKKHGIKTVFSITPDDKERALMKRVGLTLKELPFEQNGLTVEILQDFVKLVDNSGKVYVHCHGGTHRAGALGLVYRVIKEGWKYQRAEKEYLALGDFVKKDKVLLDVIKEFLEKQK